MTLSFEALRAIERLQLRTCQWAARPAALCFPPGAQLRNWHVFLRHCECPSVSIERENNAAQPSYVFLAGPRRTNGARRSKVRAFDSSESLKAIRPRFRRFTSPQTHKRKRQQNHHCDKKHRYKDALSTRTEKKTKSNQLWCHRCKETMTAVDIFTEDCSLSELPIAKHQPRQTILYIYKIKELVCTCMGMGAR